MELYEPLLRAIEKARVESNEMANILAEAFAKTQDKRILDACADADRYAIKMRNLLHNLKARPLSDFTEIPF